MASRIRESQERALYFAVLLARHTTAHPYTIARHVGHLQRLARQAKQAEERYCNEPDFDRDGRMAHLQKHADALVADIGSNVRAVLGGDCRGPCAYLAIPGHPGDGLDPDRGFAIF